MNNTEATLDGRKRVGFRNNINPTSSEADPAGCPEMLSVGRGLIAGLPSPRSHRPWEISP